MENLIKKEEDKLNKNKYIKESEKPYHWLKHHKIYLEVIGILVVGSLIYLLFRTPFAQKYLKMWLNFAKNEGKLGSFIFIVGSVILSLILNNCTLSNISAGFLYGFKEGSIFNMIIVYIIAIIAYFIGNKLLRKTIDNKLKKDPILKPLKEIKDNKDKLTEYDKLEFVALSRLPPIYPYQTISYFWGVADIKMSYFLLGTLGVIPSVLLETYFGSLMENIEEIFSKNKNGITHHIKIMIGTIVLSILVTVYIGYLAKKTIDSRVNSFNRNKNKKSK